MAEDDENSEVFKISLFSTSFVSEWWFPLLLQQPNSEAADTLGMLLQSLCSYGK